MYSVLREGDADSIDLKKAKQEAVAVDDAGDINLANALDLSESEEEEEMEDIIVDFSQDTEVNHFFPLQFSDGRN
jgi:DNA-directed RNA polymerase III subunit RPC4